MFQNQIKHKNPDKKKNTSSTHNSDLGGAVNLKLEVFVAYFSKNFLNYSLRADALIKNNLSHDMF